MKRFMLLAASILAIAFTGNAQFVMKNSADNVLKSSTAYSVGHPAGAVEDLSVQLTLTKNTGIGGAKAYLQVSNDLVGWKILPDTLTVTSSTTYPATKTWDLGPVRYEWYRTVIVTDTNTQSLRQKATFHVSQKTTMQ